MKEQRPLEVYQIHWQQHQHPSLFGIRTVCIHQCNQCIRSLSKFLPQLGESNISLAIVTLLDEMSQQCHRWQHQSSLLPALSQALEPIHNLSDDGHVIIQRDFGGKAPFDMLDIFMSLPESCRNRWQYVFR